ncbi:hypothetical protein [Halogranum amylolyticum]|nr:hypothetical protein [Halogranum amylolyticum]
MSVAEDDSLRPPRRPRAPRGKPVAVGAESGWVDGRIDTPT